MRLLRNPSVLRPFPQLALPPPPAVPELLGSQVEIFTESSGPFPPLTDSSGRIMPPQAQEQAWTELYVAELAGGVSVLQANMIRLQSSIYGMTKFPLR